VIYEDGELVPARHYIPSDDSWKTKGSWWVCRCGSRVSRYEQAFTGRTVVFCTACYKAWLQKHSFKNKRELDRWIDRNLWSIGEILYQRLVEGI